MSHCLSSALTGSWMKIRPVLKQYGIQGYSLKLNLPCYNTYTLSSLLTTATQNSDNGSMVSFAHCSLVYIQGEATVFTCSFRELELFLVKNQIQFSSYCTLNLERSSFLFFQLPGKKNCMHLWCKTQCFPSYTLPNDKARPHILDCFL